jgi:hypothetical protein
MRGVVVLQSGEVIEVGGHGDLYRTNVRYRLGGLGRGVNIGSTSLETIPKNQVERVIKAIQQFKQKEAA